MRRLLIGAVIAALLALPAPPAPAGAPSGPVALTVDLGRRLGPVPYLFRAGVFNGNTIPGAEILDKYLADLKPGAVELYLAHPTLRPSTSLQDLRRRLGEWDTVARRVAAQGGEVVVEIAAMPWWLTGNRSRRPVNPEVGDDTPVGNLSPPRDYAQWADLVGAVVDHFHNRLEVPARYTIWGEPDIVWWQGTREEYLRLYRYGVLGARRAHPAARVGGPAVSRWDGRRPGDTEPLLLSFIRAAGQTPLPELGLPRLPIDFINWHQFNANPLDPEEFGEPARQVREWLARFGYSRDTELLVGEWILWQYFGKPHAFMNEEHDTEVTAAYIVSALLAMHEAGIQRHSFAYLIDSVPGREFAGDFGLFTRRGVTKASFNAFKALSRVEGTRLGVALADPTVRGIAAEQDGRIVLVLSNFIPTGDMLRAHVGRRLRERGLTREFIARHGLEREDAERLLSGTRDLGSLQASPAERDALSWGVAFVRTLGERLTHPVGLSLRLAGARPGGYRYEQYLIDSSRGNAFAQRERIEEALRRGVPAREINEWPGVRLEPSGEGFFQGEAGPGGLVLPPQGVLMLILTPQEGGRPSGARNPGRPEGRERR